ncbi:MAG TPA: branched-chain amino acid ABC transporter permease [Rhodospirillaceae bacterium]|nr:branched-chain amino acid ABC transporter permease [Alphaproteobacteria bacterium]MAS47221.1 branched-chain amino acid ABC transporter permease [Alphaproteobacteria bacterium]MBN53231.1 branched-chain amino acid ABC transporter permease [Alphaproteobacteria bacterium]OUT41256.1 MAG: branched-chain amino acid ABC transporter permease [Micavibrio sp. TMED2]HCI47606.1 branched-chain amino acid ABC transporter permease [Rhodospirillaceae bacterium]|tara:strand:- start:15836 stop:16915 length:1080 start_codon:yes stop_codon:yes gene_type:complete
MFYREAGQFKSSYQADQAIFPILQDKIGMAIILAIAFIAIPVFGTEYFLTSLMLPFVVFSMAAIGLNILTGYCGQLSLGTGGFMACGAFFAYKLTTGFPEMNILLVFILAGVGTAMVGVLFGLPSLRIKGFYLAVATLAAQFFLIWMFNKFGWWTNHSASGVISAPPRELFPGFSVTGSSASAVDRYLFALGMVTVMALLAKNMVRSRIGRTWMAIRDMDIAAEIIGIKPITAKLSAFAISSFYIGIAGALWAFVYTSSVEALAFQIDRSFQVLFMVIIGGLGSITGSFMGAAFIVMLPILISQTPAMIGLHIDIATIGHLEYMILGALIIIILIAEPHGMARLWQIGKEKLRLWPFPH